MQSHVSVRTSPAAVEAVDPVVKRKRLRESKVWWKKESSYTISGMRTAPPCGGSHPAPKWDDSHSDIGFQLTQFPSGKRARERQGEGVGATVLFEQSVDMSAVANISVAQLQETRQKRGLREVACEQP